KGPDFPTGGLVLNSRAELREIYETGQGGVRMRGEWKVEDLPRGGKQIVITSIPYTVNKSSLVAKLGEIVRERRLAPLVDALDEMIRIIRKSDGKEDAAAKLMKRFKIDEVQTDAILDMRIYKLARLEILVVQKEAKEKRAEAKELKALLASDRQRWGVVRNE